VSRLLSWLGFGSNWVKLPARSLWFASLFSFSMDIRTNRLCLASSCYCFGFRVLGLMLTCSFLSLVAVLRRQGCRLCYCELFRWLIWFVCCVLTMCFFRIMISRITVKIIFIVLVVQGCVFISCCRDLMFDLLLILSPPSARRQDWHSLYLLHHGKL
jgi:hypothetical protein